MPTFVEPNTFGSDTGNLIVPKNRTADIIKNIMDDYGLSDPDRYVICHLQNAGNSAACKYSVSRFLSHPLYRSYFS